MKIAICEDNKMFSKYLNDTIVSYMESKKLDGEIVAICDDSNGIMRYLENNIVDIVFVDIALRNGPSSGYELAKIINDKSKSTYIVFISEHLEYVFHAFKVRAFDFLPKPITKSKIYDLLDRIILDRSAKGSLTDEKCINIKTNGAFLRLPINEIIMIEKIHNKAILHTKSKQVSCYETLDYFQKNLCENQFERVHRSYLVNTSKIKRVDIKSSEILLNHNIKCFIGNTYKKRIRMKFEGVLETG